MTCGVAWCAVGVLLQHGTAITVYTYILYTRYPGHLWSSLYQGISISIKHGKQVSRWLATVITIWLIHTFDVSWTHLIDHCWSLIPGSSIQWAPRVDVGTASVRRNKCLPLALCGTAMLDDMSMYNLPGASHLVIFVTSWFTEHTLHPAVTHFSMVGAGKNWRPLVDPLVARPVNEQLRGCPCHSVNPVFHTNSSTCKNRGNH